MLTELSVVEQRYLAVREVLDGAKVTDIATRYGIDRRTVHRWLLRYANEGLGALADRSSRPDRCPPPDRSGGRGQDRGPQEGPPGVGSPDHPGQAEEGAGSTALPFGDLPVPPPPPPDRPQAPPEEAPGLQAVGAITSHGAVADGRD